MNKMKRILAIVLAMAMVMAMSITTLAAAGVAPTPNDSAAVTIANLEDGVTLTAYQLIDATYGEGNKNLTGYAWTTQSNFTGAVASLDQAKEKITEQYIKNLAANTTGLTADANFKKNGDALTAGTWMIIVTGGADKVYNPMVVSVYYNVDGTNNSLGVATADANTNWNMQSTPGYAKSTPISIEKKIADSDVNSQVGQEVTFTVTSYIPSYIGNYTNVTYNISDHIVNGLEYVPGSMTVTGPTGMTDANYTVSGFKADSTGFTVAFDSAYVLSEGVAKLPNEARKVTITYKAKVTNDAIVKVGENKAEVEYSKSNSTETSKKDDTEYTNTVNFKGVLKKVKENGTDPLPGATFTLYDDQALQNTVGSCTTTGTCGIDFEGLDADKTYYLKETAAPAEYTLNNTVYTITFTDVQHDADGKITSYKVKVNYTDGNGNPVEKVVDMTGYNASAVEFADTVINTKLSELPSTGGIGITIFTIAGCLIMIAAAFMFFMSRRKTEE